MDVGYEIQRPYSTCRGVAADDAGGLAGVVAIPASALHARLAAGFGAAGLTGATRPTAPAAACRAADLLGTDARDFAGAHLACSVEHEKGDV